jgi:hypothetical protein
MVLSGENNYLLLMLYSYQADTDFFLFNKHPSVRQLLSHTSCQAIGLFHKVAEFNIKFLFICEK